MEFTGGMTFTGGIALIPDPLGSGNKAIFGYGLTVINNTWVGLSMTNLVSNLGIVANDTTGVGTIRERLAAAGYSQA